MGKAVMSDDIVIDKQNFTSRVETLLSTWRSKDGGFNGANSMLIILGKTDQGMPYSKSLAVFYWLLGYEFPATLLLLTTEKMYVVTTSKKAKLLQPLSTSKYPLELLVRGKDEEENKKHFETIIDAMKKSGNKVGMLVKDKEAAQGPFVNEWKGAYGLVTEKKDNVIEEVDVAVGVSQALGTFDENGQKNARCASKASVAVIHKYFMEEMSEIIDVEKKVSHEALAKKVEDKIEDDKFFRNKELKLGSDFDAGLLDWVFGPTIQSGGKYDIKGAGEAENDKSSLHAGVVIAALGLRYKSYSSFVGRTYMIDPNKTQEKYYNFLNDVHSSIVSNMKEGAVCKDIYQKAAGMVKAKYPELEKHFPRNVGFATGIESRDATMILNAKNSRTLKEGMMFVISCGFSELENPKADDKRGKMYSLLLTDTVRVGSTDGEGSIFTSGAPRAKDEVAFYFKDEEPAEPKAEKKKPASKPQSAPKNTAVLKTKLRGKREEADDGKEQRRKDNQKELATKKQEDGLNRFPAGGGPANGVEKKIIKKFESYKRDNQMPSASSDLKIVVDIKNQTIIVPIFGRPVPFHIATIKNVSKSEEDNWSFLRINLLSPGQGVGRKDDLPFEDVNAHFVRSLTYRSQDTMRIAEITHSIQDMKKNATKREQERKEMEDVVEQGSLQEVKSRRPQRLTDIYVRPALDGKRVTGDIEIHSNGLRYVAPLRSSHDHHIDILFSNVKHLFFQPCEHELIVIIHVHLKTPIMVGKKKTKDIQFYREATDIQFDETGNKKRKYRYGDEEEFEAEQEERRRRKQLDKEFQAFAEKISEAGRIENVAVDIPFRELGFSGVPFRANVLCQPTTECVVQLTDPPFLVITLDEIEVAHLERVQFGLKNFDLAFVFKDFSRPVVHINSVPVENLEMVKDWLDSVGISFTEGPLNLNWLAIMKTVQADPHQFFADGGWSFLSAETDDEDSDAESEESAYQESAADSASFGSYSDEDSYSDDDDASADEGSDASDDESGGDDDEED